jgi:hypothetical protein
MRRLGSLILQDLLLAYRSGVVLITVLVLVIMIGLVLFLPEEINIQNEMFLDSAPGQPLAAYLRQMGVSPTIIYTDETEFRSALEAQPTRIGVVFSGSIADPHFEIITQTTTAPENIGLLTESLDLITLQMRSQKGQSLPVNFLRQPAPPPPINLNMIPMMLVFEVVLLGFFFAPIMMFQEKQEGSLLAYRVTPTGALNYIFSKSALFMILGLFYGLPILLVGFGLQANYPLLLLLILLSTLMMTLFGITTAVFFRNLSEWFFIGVAILILNSIPMLSYGFPIFAPSWITWIPSYPTVFSIRNILFHGSGLGETASIFIYLLMLTVVAFIAAFTGVRYKLMREGR